MECEKPLVLTPELLIAAYQSETGNLRVVVFSDIDQAEAFLVKCAREDGLQVKSFEYQKNLSYTGALPLVFSRGTSDKSFSACKKAFCH